MSDVISLSTLQHIKNDDGTYSILLPVTTTDEVYTDLKNSITLTQQLMNMLNIISGNRLNTIDDMMKILLNLSSQINKPLDLNNIFFDDIDDLSNFIVTEGVFLNGKISI